MGLVYVFTGKGKGKTSAAFGTAMRFLGYGKRVLVVQFLKGRESGEVLLRKDLRNLDVVQFGGEKFVDLKSPSKKDIERAKEAMFYAKRVLQRVDRPDLLVLDEVNVAISSGMIKESEVLELVRKLPEKTSLILTGRGVPKGLVRKADLVTEMRDVKHPFAKGREAEKGLEY